MNTAIRTLLKLAVAFSVSALVSAVVYLSGNTAKLSDSALIFCIKFMSWTGTGAICMSISGLILTIINIIIFKVKKILTVLAFIAAMIFGSIFLTISVLLDAYISGLAI